MTYGHEKVAPAAWRQLDADRRFLLVQHMLADRAGPANDRR